jgi:hypothetical protein
MEPHKRGPRWIPVVVLFACFIFCVLFSGTDLRSGLHSFWTRTQNEQTDAEPAIHVLRVSPSELFIGDAKRLEAHLDLTTGGCVKVVAPEPDLYLGLETEVWHNGKVKWHSNGNHYVREPDTVSFSLREATDEKGQRKYLYAEGVTAKNGSGRTRHYVEMPEENTQEMILANRYTENLHHPLELIEGEKAAVWAYVISNQDTSRPFTVPSGFDEPIKTARWAFVVKVSWQRHKAPEK